MVLSIEGSGKTHTMTGSEGHSSEGIIPRAVRQVIANVISMKKSGWDSVCISASILELYNEEPRDLLLRSSTFTTSAASSNNGVSSDTNSKMKISFSQGRVTISGFGFCDTYNKNEILL